MAITMLMNPAVDMTGLRFGALLVVSRAGSQVGGAGYATWNVACDCGTKKVIAGRELRVGAHKSCGCLSAKFIADAKRRHGLTRTRIWNSWLSMRHRCHTPTDPSFARYGALGIVVCERWRESFEAFAEDMGPRPAGMTLERMNNKGNYEPDNCRWATPREQGLNRRTNRVLDHDGQAHPISEWARMTGIPKATIRMRLERGWSAKEALTVPVTGVAFRLNR